MMKQLSAPSLEMAHDPKLSHCRKNLVSIDSTVYDDDSD
jgi:hypothetical protein